MTAAPARALAHAPAGPVGGFFEAHRGPADTTGRSLLAAWTQGQPYAAFVSARAAFAAFAAQRPAARIWLPAFVCPDLVAGVAPARLRFYGVGEDFAPDLAALAAAAGGDIVVLVAHFGLPATPATRALVAARGDLTVVEDRSQALDAGPALPGAWTLHSPRKLVGVADGGLLVAPSLADRPLRPSLAADEATLWAAADWRAAEPDDNAAWGPLSQAKERAMSAAPQAMTPRSLAALSEIGLAELAQARLANWRRLDGRLRGWSALPARPCAPPLGYVLRLEPAVREALLIRLHGERIFAAVHWRAIAAPAGAFPRESAWTRELVTLPCDHRYGAAEMDRIAAVVTEALA